MSAAPPPGDDPSAWYAARPWLAHYPQGTPTAIHVDAGDTMRGLLERACDVHADRIAFELDGDDDARLTFREWHRQADALARFLVHETGLAAGDRVLFLMPNLPAFPVALFATWLAGAAAIPVYPVVTPYELEGQLRALQPRIAIVSGSLLAAFTAVAGAEDLATIVVGDADDAATPTAIAFADALARGTALAPVAHASAPGDAAVLIHTGGTTSAPKAVVLTQGSLRVGVEMLRAGTAGDDADGGRVVAIHPYSHASGLSVNLLQQASKGMTQVLFPEPFATERVVAQWRERPFRFLLAGPALYARLIATAGFDALDFSTLRIAVTGGMALREDIRGRWERVTGKALRQGYGLTETSVPIAAELLDADGCGARYPGSVGFPLPAVDVILRDPDTPGFPAVPPGAIGEVWLRGPFMMGGYFRREQDTASAFGAGGWLRTGDLGRMNDAGALYLLGRIKDVIIVDGVNAYPASIEDVVGACPGVADVCAVGMPDAECGERVRLFVVRRDAMLDATTVAAWCAERLSAFKQPRRIEFIDALPRSAVDKVLRRELAQRPLS